MYGLRIFLCGESWCGACNGGGGARAEPRVLRAAGTREDEGGPPWQEELPRIHAV